MPLVNEVTAQANEAKLLRVARIAFPDLREPEHRILHDSVRPGPADALKDDIAEKRLVRGAFLRWLLNDKAACAYIDKDGLQVVASTIEDELDLDSARISFDLTFKGCVFNDTIHFNWAQTRSIYVKSSRLQGDAEFQNATIDGDLALANGLESHGSISMYGAHVAGDVILADAKLLESNKPLYIVDAIINGAIDLGSGFSCAGPVWILGTKVGFEVDATEAQFGSTVAINNVTIAGDLALNSIKALGTINIEHSAIGGSLRLDGAKLKGVKESVSLRNSTIAGDVSFSSDFKASGAVSLWQAAVKRSVLIKHAEMQGLDCAFAEIGMLSWVSIVNPQNTTLTLTRTTVRDFVDEKKSWPSKGKLRVEGFVYEQADMEVPNDRSDPQETAKWKGRGIEPDDRIAWLNRQSDADLIISQPWMQLAQFLQARGNSAGAKKVLYTMQRYQAEGHATRPLTFFYDVFEESPLRVMIPIALLWLFGTIVFWRARRMKAMAPTEQEAFDKFQTTDPPPHYVPFNAAIYTLENVLPVVKLGQDSAWAPNPQASPVRRKGWRRAVPQISYNWLAFLRWLLIVLGWVLALILAGAIGSTFKT